MPIESEEAGKRQFVTKMVPRLAGVAGFLVYLITINPWISFSSLGTVTRLSGGTWHPAVDQPLTLALFYPFRFLPASWVPFALNLFTVFIAAVVLALLARSVALLPHNITPEHLLRKNQPAAILSTPGAWMPPVLAVILCGLQSSFWEHATSASGEMIDLLIFAAVIRSLLEFRVSREPAWLVRCALFYGAGMANNWAMIAFFPLFAAALLRIAGIDLFLKGRLPLRLALWGAAGLGLYLLLPILYGITSDQMTFWTALKENLKSQWNALSILQRPSFRILAITSLLPLLVLSVRWKSHTIQSGDDSRFAVFLTRATGHVIHALLLFTSVWIALDPAFGPRHAIPGTTMLSYYYVSALIFGYCAGYFLLLGHGKTRTPLAKRAMAATFILVCALPILLGWKNLGQVRALNGPAVHEFARQLYADLPEGKSVVLSDDPSQLALLQAELRAHHREKDVVPLETFSLFSPGYQHFVGSQFKSRWPVELPTNRFETMTAGEMLKLVSAFAAREPVIYLHPSSGFYFENLMGEPQGSVFRLLPRPLEDVRLPRLPDAVASRNEEIWQQRWTNGLQQLASRRKLQTPVASTKNGRSLSDRLRLVPVRDFSSAWLGMRYSKTLNCWGVELQRMGRWPEAGVWFARALELNPRNVSAKINLKYNERCRDGDRAPLDPASPNAPFQDHAASFDEWSEIISSDGAMDEPFFLLRTSRMLQASGNIRQAACGFARCVELAPDWPPAKLQLAQSYLELGDFAAALALSEGFPVTNQLSGPGLASLLDCRATALQKMGRSAESIASIEKFVEDYREHSEVLVTAADLYEQSKKFKEQLAVIDELLRRESNRPALLSRKGLTELRLSRYEEAIGSLTSALSLMPSHNGTRLLRAIACMGADKLDAARNDYQALLEVPGSSLDATFGLATIAWRQQDTNQAIQFYRQYVSNGIPDSPQYILASDRLKLLTGNPAK